MVKQVVGSTLEMYFDIILAVADMCDESTVLKKGTDVFAAGVLCCEYQQKRALSMSLLLCYEAGNSSNCNSMALARANWLTRVHRQHQYDGRWSHVNSCKDGVKASAWGCMCQQHSYCRSMACRAVLTVGEYQHSINQPKLQIDEVL